MTENILLEGGRMSPRLVARLNVIRRLIHTAHKIELEGPSMREILANS